MRIQDGVEGGIRQASAGPLAYAFPTYKGTGPKTDLPLAERSQIEGLSQATARDGQPADRRTTSRATTDVAPSNAASSSTVQLGWRPRQQALAARHVALAIGPTPAIAVMFG